MCVRFLRLAICLGNFSSLLLHFMPCTKSHKPISKKRLPGMIGLCAHEPFLLLYTHIRASWRWSFHYHRYIERNLTYFILKYSRRRSVLTARCDRLHFFYRVKFKKCAILRKGFFFLLQKKILAKLTTKK